MLSGRLDVMRLVTKYLIYQVIFLSSLGFTWCGLKLPAQTFQNTDAFLTNGSNASFTYTVGGSSSGVVITAKRSPYEVLWYLGPNPWGLTQGSGQIGLGYNGNGTVQWSVNLTNLNPTQVIGFPFMGVGNDVWGYQNGKQGLPFPVPVSNLYSLTTEVQYSLAGQINTNLDVLFDLWLAPTTNYSAGNAGAVEIEIFPYCNYGGYWGAYVKTISLPCLLNGQATNLTFYEYDAVRSGSGGGKGAGTTILFYPKDFGLTSGDLQFDAAVLIREAATTAAVGSWYLPGYNIGTEFGLGNSANFSFTLGKFRFALTLPPLLLSAPKMAAARTNFVFVLSGPAGSNCVMQVSTNLVNWIPASTSAIPLSGSINATNSISNSKQAYYRAYLQ